MKIFIAYRYSGNNLKILKSNMERIGKSLEKAGHSYFCTFWNEEDFQRQNASKRQILECALKELHDSDCILAFVRSKKKSEGMLLELGYALAKKKKFILAIKKGIRTTFIGEMADKVIEFESLDGLCQKLEKL